MPSRSRRSVKPSTTSRRTSSAGQLRARQADRRASCCAPSPACSRIRPGRPTGATSYERLEFLGDSVLELAVARALYDAYPDFAEGELARLRAHIVSRQSCAVVADELGLQKLLVEHARGRLRGGGRASRQEPQRARGAARGRAGRALPRARFRGRSKERSPRPSAAASSTRRRATSTTRRSCRRSSRATAAR